MVHLVYCGNYKMNEYKKAPTVGLEPTTIKLRA